MKKAPKSWTQLWKIGTAIAFSFWCAKGTALAIPVSSIPANVNDSTRETSIQEAGSLTEKGHELLGLGKPEAAFASWQRALELYRQLGDRNGTIGSYINQSLALKALGQYRRACQTLAISLEISERICDRAREETTEIDLSQKQLIDAMALRHLGNVLRIVGNLETSKAALDRSLTIAENFRAIADIDETLLALANTERAVYNRQRDLYERRNESIDRQQAIASANRALKYYEKISNNSGNETRSTALRSQLNRLSLLIELDDWLQAKVKAGNRAIEDEWQAFHRQILPAVEELLANPELFENLSPSQSIYAKLNLADSLIKTERLSLALDYAIAALQQAEILKDGRGKAYAYGAIGQIYEAEKQWSAAEKFTESAIATTQIIQAPDIAYQWEWQLGRIYDNRGEIERAIAAYTVAIENLEFVRQDLLSIDPEVQFSFRENVKPVYEEFIRLLLRSGDRDNLQQVTEVSGLLQLAELENFLRCNLTRPVPLYQAEKPPDAGIYAIVLEEANRVELIVSVSPPNGSPIFHHYSAAWDKVQPEFNRLQTLLQSDNLRGIDPEVQILPAARKLYELLIEPGKQYLPNEGTLVFVLDSLLQSIPLGLLQDSEGKYLIENYSIALSLRSQLPPPESLPRDRLKALIAGVSDAPSFGTEFLALDNIETELEYVEQQTIASKILQNEEFTRQEFERQVNQVDFPVIHIATHAQFSSNPEETFILAYDDKINVSELDSILRVRTEGTFNAIALLVLSACQTAQSDKRGGLGLAGIAVQAGAESTVASLWNVSDNSTPELMNRFYQELKNGATKAEALRQAQLSLLKDSQHAHPYYWAAFVLIGSWL